MHLVQRLHKLRMALRRAILAALALVAVCGGWASGQPQSSSLRLLQADLETWYRTSIDGSHQTELLPFSTVIAIDPALTGADPLAAQQSLLLLTDSAPSPMSIFSSSGRRTYDVYQSILSNRAIETERLTSDELRRLKSARYLLLDGRCAFLKLLWKILGKQPRADYSRRYLAYLEFARKYAALETQLLRENDQEQRKRLQTAIIAMLDEWKKKGHKEKIDVALKDLREITAKDPERFWAQAVTDFRRNVTTIKGISLPLTRIRPSVKEWTQSSEWRPWQTGTSSGSLLLVSIDRTWLNIEVLTTQDWSWGEGIFKHDEVLISDGLGSATQDAKRELMPLLPIKLLVAKNLVIGGQPLGAGEPVFVGVICLVLPRLPAK